MRFGQHGRRQAADAAHRLVEAELAEPRRLLETPCVHPVSSRPHLERVSAASAVEESPGPNTAGTAPPPTLALRVLRVTAGLE